MGTSFDESSIDSSANRYLISQSSFVWVKRYALNPSKAGPHGRCISVSPFIVGPKFADYNCLPGF
jgi:hypothetical protein